MIQTNCYLIAVAQVPERATAFDFYIMHAVNFVVPLHRRSRAADLALGREQSSFASEEGLAAFCCLRIMRVAGTVSRAHPIATHRKPGDWDSIIARTVEYKTTATLRNPSALSSWAKSTPRPIMSLAFLCGLRIT
jgi:hypothetical protein